MHQNYTFLYLILSKKILKAILLTGTLLGRKEIDTVALSAEFALRVEQLHIDINHLTALAHQSVRAHRPSNQLAPLPALQPAPANKEGAA